MKLFSWPWRKPPEPLTQPNDCPRLSNNKRRTLERRYAWLLQITRSPEDGFFLTEISALKWVLDNCGNGTAEWAELEKKTDEFFALNRTKAENKLRAKYGDAYIERDSQ